MPKPIKNNKIIYPTILGRVSVLDSFINQGVKIDDSPTFGGLYVTGDSTIEGNLYVEGNTTILGTNVIEFEDNIILLNRLETGSGVTLNQAGFEIQRGSLENYRVIFNESDDTFRVGVISNTQAVATREDSPLSNGLMMWNSTAKRMDSRNNISIDIKVSSTTNSTSSTNGCLQLDGGIGVKKDLHMDGKLYITGSNFSNKTVLWTDTSNSFYVTSPQDIYLSPANKINIPYNKSITFGVDTQSISANSISSDLNINAAGHINLEVPFGKRINIPNQIALTFSSANEKIYADDSNNMVVSTLQDIQLTPGPNKKVVIPVDKSLAFYNENQRLYSNLTGDLFILAGNNINLVPALGLDVKIPAGSGIKFGGTGYQRIIADVNNKLTISCNSDLELNSQTRVSIPVDVSLTFKNTEQSITGDTYGNLKVTAGTRIKLYKETEILDTTNSSNYGTGALIVRGGAGVEKNLNIGGNVSVDGDLIVSGTTVTINTETLTVEDNLFIINNTPQSSADAGVLIKRFGETSGNAYAGIFYKESNDEFTLAYTQSDPGQSNVNISGYIPIHAKNLILEGTDNVTTLGTGSLITPGGVSIGESLRVNGVITAGSINVTGSSYISILQSEYNKIITQTCENIRVTNELSIDSTLDVINATTASFVLYGGMSLVKSLWVGSKVRFFDTTPSSNLTTGNLVMTGGISIQNTENSSSVTSGGGITVAGGGSFGKDLFVGGHYTGNSLKLLSSIQSTNSSSGSLVSFGGISINNTSNAESFTNGGSLTVAGGSSINKDVYIGGDTNMNGNLKVNNEVTIDGTLNYSGNGMFVSIENTESSSSWNYLGVINNSNIGTLDLNLTNGIDYRLDLLVSINDTTANVSHYHSGEAEWNSNKSSAYIYKDSTDKFHLFINTLPNSSTFVNVKSKLGERFILSNEGTSNLPDGNNSGFDVSWEEIYNTNNESNMKLSVGNFISEGDEFKVQSNIGVIGYNNQYTDGSRKLALLLQRFQKSNDSIEGDVIKDTIDYIDMLPSQSTVNNNQIKLSNSASSQDNYYVGWWVKVTSGNNTNQVRQIISYNGSQRLATLDSPWTSTSPVQNDNVSLYGNSCVGFSFSNTDKLLKIGYTNYKDNLINYKQGCSVETSRLILKSTENSNDSSSGSLITFGGITINNTTDSSNSSDGGSITCLGGAGINKNLYVGENIGVGVVNSINNSIHINQNRSTIKLQNDTTEYSYMDFVETGTNNSFGILSDNDSQLFSLTYSTTSQNPYDSEKALTVNNSGFVGINTTDINSALTIKENNFISTNLNSGFLGIKAGPSNDNSDDSARIIICGNEEMVSSGSLELYSGTSGSISLFTDNTPRIVINSEGTVNINSTHASLNSTVAALIVSGGISANSTEDSVSASNGGSLTVAGGASIGKKLIVGGDLEVLGSFATPGDVLTPTITFSNQQNCSISSYGTNKICYINDEIILSFYVEVLPDSTSSNCEFQFVVPERTSNFTKRLDIISNVSGYTDDNDVIPLFNVICVGVKNSTNALVKFQSVSTSIHYLQVICRYLDE